MATINIGKSIINGLLFLDLKKAFDTVDHKILLLKLEQYEIRGISLDLLKSYLSNKQQIHTIQNC